ncbi:MAG: N-acetylmuramoyl-L-alanine amidase [Bacillota bacterium]
MSCRSRIFLTTLFFFTALFFTQSSRAAPPPPPAVKVQVAGREVTFDVPPVIENGRTLVPLRGIAEALGARVAWEEKSKTVTIAKDGETGSITVKLTVGKTIALKNTEKIALDVPAKIIQNRTMVPLRFVGEALGAAVRWDPASRLVSINKAVQEEGKEKPGRQLVVQGDGVNIRSGPGTTHDILSQVSRGARLPVLDRQAEWYKVQLPGGQTGWIIAWYAKEEPESAPSPAAPATPEKPAPAIPVPGPKDNNEVGTGKQEQPGTGQPGQTDAPAGNGQAQAPPGNKDSEKAGQAPQTGQKQETTLKVTVRQENEITRVEIAGNQKVTYNIFRLRTPDRLVMDIQGIPPGDLPPVQDVNTKAVSSIRTGWFSRNPDTTRLVFDLKEQVIYKVKASADQTLITLDISIPNLKDALQGRTIVLDPGHGGSDPGATGRTTGLQEKDVNLDVARRTAGLLSGYGARVVLTRRGDDYVDLDERVRKANSAGADLFVSIHMNANNSTDLKGTSTYYVRTGKDNARLAQSRRLAESVQNSLLAALGLEDKGVRQADFVVLRDTTMPAVLVEAAFISNPQEEKLMAAGQFRENLAQAIVQGLGNYLISSY